MEKGKQEEESATSAATLAAMLDVSTNAFEKAIATANNAKSDNVDIQSNGVDAADSNTTSDSTSKRENLIPCPACLKAFKSVPALKVRNTQLWFGTA